MSDSQISATELSGYKVAAERGVAIILEPADTMRVMATLAALQAENKRLREVVGEIKLAVEDEGYKVSEGQHPCKHTDALNEIYGICTATLEPRP